MTYPNPHVRTAAATLAGVSARHFAGALLAARIMWTQGRLPTLNADLFGDEEARGTPAEPRREKPENRGLAQSAALRFTFLTMPADIPIMPIYGRHFEPGQLQFITTSTYRRSRLFASQRFCWTLVEALRQVRQETRILLIGWVLMPEHFHLLIKPEPAEDTVRFMQEIKKRSAQQIIATLARNQHHPWCRTMLARRKRRASLCASRPQRFALSTVAEALCPF